MISPELPYFPVQVTLYMSALYADLALSFALALSIVAPPFSVGTEIVVFYWAIHTIRTVAVVFFVLIIENLIGTILTPHQRFDLQRLHHKDALFLCGFCTAVEIFSGADDIRFDPSAVCYVFGFLCKAIIAVQEQTGFHIAKANFFAVGCQYHFNSST
jgi:hypothetical protein